jgi:Uma2 family endonuclease
MKRSTGTHKKRYSWNDYRSWDDDKRWEIIDGELYDMSPSPTTRHQMISSELAATLHGHVKGGKCRVFPAPMDVKLSDEDVVQPDLLVVCNSSQIKNTHIEGPPELVVEIASPSTATHDRIRKLRLYARSGIKEYWLVSPYPSLIEVLLLDGETYRIQAAFGKTDILRSPTFPDLQIDLKDVFSFPIDPGEEIMEIREAQRPVYQTSPRR